MRKKLVLAVALLCTALALPAQECFKNFPEAARPENVGARLAARFLQSGHMSPRLISYPEVCTWDGALRYADIVQDTTLLRRLEERFQPLFAEEAHLLPRKNHVDCNVFGSLALELYMQTQNRLYYKIGMDYADTQWTLPDDAGDRDREFARKGLSWQTRMWIDDMYMVTHLQLRAYEATGDPRYLDRAAREMSVYLNELQQENGLFYHAPEVPFHWARGNGWCAVGMAELLSCLPETHAEYPVIMAGYKKMMQTLKRYQTEEGVWRQLIDRNDIWVETSGSAMFVYAFILGVKNHWLDEETYGQAARKGWITLVSYLDGNDDLREVCIGTGKKNSESWYYERPRHTGDLHGQAPMIWCAAALSRLDLRPTTVTKPAPIDRHRAAQIAALLPDVPQGMGHNYKDRETWDRLGKDTRFARLPRIADAILERGFPKWDQAVYDRVFVSGDTQSGKEMVNRRLYALAVLVWAECLQNDGRYTPAIQAAVYDILGQKTWVNPRNYNERNYGGLVELATAMTAHLLTQTLFLMDDKLPSSMRQEVLDGLYKRAYDPLRKTLDGQNRDHFWLTSTGNWNPVCLEGVACSALAIIPDRFERACWAAVAEKYSKNYVLGFLDDGYCSEGLNYYNYGMSHYLVLREKLFTDTGGKIDLYDANPKIRQIACFLPRMEIVNKVYPTIADCLPGISPSATIMTYLNRTLGLELPIDKNPDSVLPPNLTDGLMNLFPTGSASASATPYQEDPLRSYFQDAGVLITRTAARQEPKMGAALKGGHNNEHHNHNDVGSYTLVLGAQKMVEDPGLIPYTMKTFSAERYSFLTLASYGHPVPLVAGKDQCASSEARAAITHYAVSDQADTLEMDIKSAYPVKELLRLNRKFIFDREHPSLTVTDTFAFSSRQTFETAITTRARWSQAGKDCILLEREGEKMVLTIRTGKTGYEILSEELSEGGTPYTRLAIRLKKTRRGTVQLEYRPAQEEGAGLPTKGPDASVSPGPSDFQISRGINISCWLSQTSVRKESAETYFQEKDIRQIASLGFDHIRLPVDETELFTDDLGWKEDTKARIHRTIALCQKHHLRIVLDLHILRSHYFNNKETMTLWKDPAQQDRMVKIWQMLSAEFGSYPTSLLAYELLNEPVPDTPDQWNRLAGRLIAEIRKNEPGRMILVCPGSHASIGALPLLETPAGDMNLMYCVHFYTPHLLTHYHANWWPALKRLTVPLHYPGQLVEQADIDKLTDKDNLRVVNYYNGYYDKDVLAQKFQIAFEKSEQTGLKIHIGEVGCIDDTEETAKVNWLRDVASICKEHGMSYSVWGYKANFGLFNNDGTIKNKQVIDALTQ